MAKVAESRVYDCESEMLVALREMFPHPEYALLQGVADATGYGKVRTADALVMGCWPSRGTDLIGIEVKVSRSDWLRELKDPAKAESVCRYCDRWYVAVGDAEIVRDGELPPTWGLIVPKGKKLARSVQAPKLDALPMSREFLASILRKVYEADRSRWSAEIHEARRKGFQEGKESAETRDHSEAVRAKAETEKLRGTIAGFEAASGVQLHQWHDNRKVGEAVRFVLRGGLTSVPDSVALAEREAQCILDSARRYREAVARETPP